MREPAETSTVFQGPVSINPRFFRDHSEGQKQLKLQYEAHVALVCTQNWINAPEFVLIASSGMFSCILFIYLQVRLGRSFVIRVDPTQLTPGFHFGEILGYDTNQRHAGPLFRIPVTVCKPDNVTSSNSLAPLHADAVSWVRYNELNFTPGVTHRKFVSYY